MATPCTHRTPAYPVVPCSSGLRVLRQGVSSPVLAFFFSVSHAQKVGGKHQQRKQTAAHGISNAVDGLAYSTRKDEMHSNDDRSGPREAPFTQPGLGLVCAWECFGCKRRIASSLGARGIGLQRRCAQCVEAKNKGRAC